MCLALVAGLKQPLSNRHSEPSEVLKTLLRQKGIMNARALVLAAVVLSKDKLLKRPVAQMQVYNAPLQGNGSRIEVVGGNRNKKNNGAGFNANSTSSGGSSSGSRSLGAQIEVKRAPMEGYVVGVKSQTLYWCVLEGPKLLWYADPARKVTVAQTWLDGCVIKGLGNGLLEIQAPQTTVTTTTATTTRSVTQSQSSEPTAAAEPAAAAAAAADEMKKKEDNSMSAACVTASALSAERLTTTSTTNHASITTTTTTTNHANMITTSTTTTRTSTPPVFANAVKEGSAEAGHTGGEKGTAGQGTFKGGTTNGHAAAVADDDQHSSSKNIISTTKPRMSVRLEINDEDQYRQWLERLQEAAMYSVRGRSMWRQCFL